VKAESKTATGGALGGTESLIIKATHIAIEKGAKEAPSNLLSLLKRFPIGDRRSLFHSQIALLKQWPQKLRRNLRRLEVAKGVGILATGSHPIA